MITENSVSSEEIAIEAPVELVWDVLVDFANYGRWNPFCPSAEAELVLDTPIVMKTWLGENLIDQVEYICRIEPCEAIAWRMENKPGDPVHARRTQTLKKLDDQRCTYFTIDEFSGEAMPAMLEQFSRIIEDGFNACGQGLKAYCEAQHQSS